MKKIQIVICIIYIVCVHCRHLEKTPSDARTLNRPVLLDSLDRNAQTQAKGTQETSVAGNSPTDASQSNLGGDMQSIGRESEKTENKNRIYLQGEPNAANQNAWHTNNADLQHTVDGSSLGANAIQDSAEQETLNKQSTDNMIDEVVESESHSHEDIHAYAGGMVAHELIGDDVEKASATDAIIQSSNLASKDSVNTDETTSALDSTDPAFRSDVSDASTNEQNTETYPDDSVNLHNNADHGNTHDNNPTDTSDSGSDRRVDGGTHIQEIQEHESTATGSHTNLAPRADNFAKSNSDTSPSIDARFDHMSNQQTDSVQAQTAKLSHTPVQAQTGDHQINAASAQTSVSHQTTIDDKTSKHVSSSVSQNAGDNVNHQTTGKTGDISHTDVEDEASVNQERNQTNSGPDTVRGSDNVPSSIEAGNIDDGIDVTNANQENIATTTRNPEDVDPLNIFVDDIKYQRFPPPMTYTTFEKKILGRRFKKLYVLEESDRKLFQQVRQLEAQYTMEDDELYVSFLFRFIYSRTCQQVKKFRLGKLIGNRNRAYFEKELEDGVVERIIFFSEMPDDYVYFMSCTDKKTSPYACRDSYYVTLDSAHDPPNQFPWLAAAEELRAKMHLSFEDPRFMFNFVMLPCARA